MRVHILGVCGTFMGSLAILAKEMGFKVTGSDENVYPPMSTLLQEHGIEIFDGYDPDILKQKIDYIIIGNVMKRGMPIIEYILNNNLAYLSGPEFLKYYVLKDKHVLAVSGTHGKTTTSSMLAWILDQEGMKPGFLIGGVPKNFNVSARLGNSKYFVIEADEYDSAFFDKRSKFLHYKPNTLIINNIEFDHADIFENIDSIKKQFHHLIRIVPQSGKIIYRASDINIQSVLKQGVWSNTQSFDLYKENEFTYKTLQIAQIGDHNKLNALASIAAAHDIGIPIESSIDHLKTFKGVKRRLETLDVKNGITILDDFAHHPTAIKETINAVKNFYIDNIDNRDVNKDANLNFNQGKKYNANELGVISKTIKNVNNHDNAISNFNFKPNLITVIDLGSNTMKMGFHKETLVKSIENSSFSYFFSKQQLPEDFLAFLKTVILSNNSPLKGVYFNSDELVNVIASTVKSGDAILFLSNGSIENIQAKLSAKLSYINY